MVPKLTSSRRAATRLAHKGRKKKNNPHFVTRAQLIKRCEELQENLKCCLKQFEDLRSEYLNAQNRNNLMKENNRDLACRNAALSHENDMLKLQISQIAKDNLIKISAAKRDHTVFIKNLIDKFNSFTTSIVNEIDQHDPLSLLHEEFEKSLTMDDISNLEKLSTRKRQRGSQIDEFERQERIKEKLNNIYIERIDLTAMAEEQSHSSNFNNGSTFSIDSRFDESLSTGTSNHLCSTLLERANTVSTPSFRRIVPKTPQLNVTDASSPSITDKDSWVYDSGQYKFTPPQQMLSTTLDSIQNFVPKTPILTQPMATTSTTTCDSTTANNSLKSFVNRLSVAYPEQSPITTTNTRVSRRLLDSTISSRVSSETNFEVTNASKKEEKTEGIELRRSTRTRKKVRY